jgi:hypothetical protein
MGTRISSRACQVLLATANAVPSSQILSTLKMEATHSSETSVLTRPRRPHIPEGGLLHSHRRENLKTHSPSSVIHRSPGRLSRAGPVCSSPSVNYAHKGTSFVNTTGSGKGAGSIPGEVNNCYQFTKSFQPHWALGVTSVSEKNVPETEIRMLLGSRARPVCQVDIVTATCHSVL